MPFPLERQVAGDGGGAAGAFGGHDGEDFGGFFPAASPDGLHPGHLGQAASN